MCLSDFTKVKWFGHETCWSSTDQGYVENPTGDLCETCGTCTEVWPLMTVAELRQKIAEDGEFKTIWKTVRTGVVAAQSRLALRLEKVLSVQRTGFSISRACAFVRSDEYKTKLVRNSAWLGARYP